MNVKAFFKKQLVMSQPGYWHCGIGFGIGVEPLQHTGIIKIIINLSPFAILSLYSLSIEVKQILSLYYNRKYRQKGTFWGERRNAPKPRLAFEKYILLKQDVDILR